MMSYIPIRHIRTRRQTPRNRDQDRLVKLKIQEYERKASDDEKRDKFLHVLLNVIIGGSISYLILNILSMIYFLMGNR